jgi:hypothetical protein
MKNVLLKTFVSLAKEYDRILTESVRRGRWLDQLILRWSTIYKNNNGTVGWNFLIKVICERGRAPIVPLETSSEPGRRLSIQFAIHIVGGSETKYF